MAKIFSDWLMNLGEFPLLTLALMIACAAAWMTEIHLTTSQTNAAVAELGQKTEKEQEKVWRELNTQRQMTIESLQSIDRRLSHIEGKLSK